MITVVRQITNETGSILLWDLYSTSKGEYYFEPCLEFKDDLWNNSEYLLDFLRGLKKNKKEQLKELKEYCKEYNLNYESTREDLLDIYKASKELKWWRKK